MLSENRFIVVGLPGFEPESIEPSLQAWTKLADSPLNFVKEAVVRFIYSHWFHGLTQNDP